MDNEYKKPMTKRELVREIADVTQIQPAIVMSMLNAFSDIFMRETVLNGRFNLVNCFSVKTHTRKKRSQYNVNKGEFEDFPEIEILDITLAKKINYFHRWKQRNQYNAEHNLTIEDWQNRKGPEIPKRNS